MQLIRSAVAAGIAAALAATLVGCGGDDGLSETEYRSQAQRVCRDAQAELDRLGEGFNDTEPTQQQFEDAFAKIPGILDQQVEDLEALEPPDDLADDVAAMLDSVREAAAAIEEQGADILSGAQDPFAEANERAMALGLDDCADE